MPAPAAVLPADARVGVATKIDAITIVCIAIIAYLFAALFHEGLGHGLAAVILGARDIRLSTTALHSDPNSITATGSRIICLAGPAVGLVSGFLLALYHARTRSTRAEARYCLWLTAYVCLFSNSGYLMALSFFHFGDIHGFVDGLEYTFWWRLGLTIIGTVLSFVTLYYAARTLDEFLGRANRRARAAKLIIISYCAGCASLILSTFLSTRGSHLVLVSAIPATLGGTVLLLYTIVWAGVPGSTTRDVPLTPQRKWTWYAAGAIAIIFHLLVFGPGFPR